MRNTRKIFLDEGLDYRKELIANEFQGFVNITINSETDSLARNNFITINKQQAKKLIKELKSIINNL